MTPVATGATPVHYAATPTAATTLMAMGTGSAAVYATTYSYAPLPIAPSITSAGSTATTTASLN